MRDRGRGWTDHKPRVQGKDRLRADSGNSQPTQYLGSASRADGGQREVICSSGLRTVTLGLYDNDFGTSVSFLPSGPTQQFRNDKRKLKIVENIKHSDAEENTGTLLELDHGYRQNGKHI